MWRDESPQQWVLATNCFNLRAKFSPCHSLASEAARTVAPSPSASLPPNIRKADAVASTPVNSATHAHRGARNRNPERGRIVLKLHSLRGGIDGRRYQPSAFQSFSPANWPRLACCFGSICATGRIGALAASSYR
jgi:hypothetical protein